MTQEGYTHIEMVCDRSGSMASIASAMNAGIAKFIAEQRENNDGKTTFGFRQFDTAPGPEGYEPDLEQTVPPTDLAHYTDTPTINPRGGTPLYDAIGWAVKGTEAWIESLEAPNRPSRVFVVIITDGYENSSKEWTQDTVFELVKNTEQDKDWQFIYMGANQDAMSVGGSIAVGAAGTTSYAPNAASVQAMYASASAGITTTTNTGAVYRNAVQDVTTDEGIKASLKAVEDAKKTKGKGKKK